MTGRIARMSAGGMRPAVAKDITRSTPKLVAVPGEPTAVEES
jgi:hypothetical protein